MPEVLIYLIILISLFVLELVYFRIAFHYKIIDKPNDRSSHRKITIRGGGVIFSAAALIWFFYSGFSYPYFLSGLLLIAFISFLDDLHTLKSGIRSLVHILAVSLLLYQLGLDLAWYWLPVILILIVGTINAYNFMDGINGITGGYSLILLSSLFYINRYVAAFTSESLLIISILSLLVFNYFNFRRKAKCFAGDVGSVSIAFIICFLLIQLIVQTENVLFIGFLLVYGLDAVTTILFRLIRKENIFEAHRTHFYQYLANERKWLHLWVSGLYVMVQLLINALIIWVFSSADGFEESFYWLLGLGFISGLVFLLIRFGVERKERLFKRSNARTFELKSVEG
jgi:UDP-N-acetylmuramyl pentapeptide phosphotransferase/UDP-N-acetylglucosamine-1-phosphate transferase